MTTPSPFSAPLATARLIALAVPVVLLGGALLSQYVGGLYPCEMCYWQRWPHFAAIVLAALAITVRSGGISRVLTALAGLAILISGAIGVFHAGVEYRWWDGLTQCSAAATPGVSGADILANIWATPLIRCDQAQWTLGGVSLAGFNAIFSIAAAIIIFTLLTRREARA